MLITKCITNITRTTLVCMSQQEIFSMVHLCTKMRMAKWSTSDMNERCGVWVTLMLCMTRGCWEPTTSGLPLPALLLPQTGNFGMTGKAGTFQFTPLTSHWHVESLKVTVYLFQDPCSKLAKLCLSLFCIIYRPNLFWSWRTRGHYCEWRPNHIRRRKQAAESGFCGGYSGELQQSCVQASLPALLKAWMLRLLIANFCESFCMQESTWFPTSI